MEAGEGIRPPRLEDAGLEDCALPPESIKQAFLKAASAVRSRDTSILSQSDHVYDPWPITVDSSDALVGITPETGAPGSCAGEKGEEVPESLVDKVVQGESDADDELVGVEGASEGGELERFEDRKRKE